VETSESYKMLHSNDLETFRLYSKRELVRYPRDECPKFQNHVYFEAASSTL